MLARLSYKDACRYIDNRAKNGFNVIQTVILTELDMPEEPLAAGMQMMQHADDYLPTEAYLSHIDSVVDYAARRGIWLALVPTWGDKVDKQWGKGPVVFTPERAAEYGRLLANRYKDRRNIIWIIGGDRGGDGNNAAVWNAMAESIKAVDHDHLMTFHPHGEHSSSMWFHSQKWLDFNMIQSGHCQQTYDIYRRLLLPDMLLAPEKPVMDGEPRYEDIPRNFRLDDGRFTDIDVRRTLYQSVLSGACGYTYGNNNLWQMYTTDRKPQCDARIPWKKAMNMPGAKQIKHFVRLWQSLPYRQGTPVTNVIHNTDNSCSDAAVAFLMPETMLCYTPGGTAWSITLPDGWTEVEYYLMNPRTGKTSKPQNIKNTKDNNITITLPDSLDWTIIINKK